MLKVFGGIYANTKEDFSAIISPLETNGFQIAYQGETNGTIIKEVENLDESEDSEA